MATSYAFGRLTPGSRDFPSDLLIGTPARHLANNSTIGPAIPTLLAVNSVKIRAGTAPKRVNSPKRARQVVGNPSARGGWTVRRLAGKSRSIGDRFVVKEGCVHSDLRFRCGGADRASWRPSAGGSDVMRFFGHMVRGETTEHFLSRRGRILSGYDIARLLFFRKEGRARSP